MSDSDSLANLPSEEDLSFYKDVSYDEIRVGMQQALAADPNCKTAHLGMALLEVVEVNYDTAVWELIDSLDVYVDDDDESVTPPERLSLSTHLPTGLGLFVDRRSPLIGNQFTLLATAPRQLALTSMSAIPSNLTIARAQQVITDVVLPALESAFTHLQQAEAQGGAGMTLWVEDEVLEIDLGDILFFDAALHAARAGLLIAVAYDLDLFGPDGTYGWIDEIEDREFCRSWHGYVAPYEPEPEFNSLTYVESDSSDAYADSTLIAMLKYNLEHRSGFLERKNSNMTAAYHDLQTMQEKLVAAVAAIRGEAGDPQEDDIIKIIDLVELDDDIASEEDKPKFAEHFSTIEDVLTWVDQVLNGNYYLKDEGSSGEYGMTVRLRNLFEQAPDNWQEFLPYYRFRDPKDWIEWDTHTWSYSASPTWTYDFYTCDGEWREIDNLKEVVYLTIGYDIDFIELLDGPDGNPIDLEEATIPYFADYTFNGLFPTATRAEWLQLFEDAGW